MVNEKELTQFDKKALGVLEMAKSITITDDDQYDEVGRFLTSGIKSHLKDLDATFDPAIKAQRAAMEELREAKNRHAKPILEAEGITKDKLAEYRAKRQAEIEAENRKALEAAAKTGKALTAPHKEMPKVAGVSYRKDYTAEVVDMVAFLAWVVGSKDRQHYVEPVMSALKKLAQATQGAVSIPGVRFGVKDIVAGRAG